jgi:hypothetical protein
MQRAAIFPICLVLMFSYLCPSHCLAQTVQADSCCSHNSSQGKNRPGTASCSRVICDKGPEMAQYGSASHVFAAVPAMTGIAPRVIPAAVMLPPAPRPLKPPDNGCSTVRRI